MSEIVIKVENLSKQYRLGTVSHRTLGKDLQAWWARMRGKQDPNSQVGSNFSLLTDHISPEKDRFWALKDISFNVKQGEVLGIIGKNGAGKSTLLKVISRVTTPTRGQIKIKGRVASLLEVGTGFHPELTGRENIFLNGAILGMIKAEIKQKFDEIVTFAEVEKFIDTPVKRYSSGMYVRLAFAVAAHLEPEILVVDEVLAVGDAQFQKKCLGKMEDVSTREGRTVLFVSHNMAAISQLCNRSILLNNGQLAFHGDVHKATQLYLRSGRGIDNIDNHNFIGTLKSKIEFIKVNINGHPFDAGEISPSSDITITVEGRCIESIPKFRTSIVIYKEGVRICTLHDTKTPKPIPQGLFLAEAKIPAFLLRPAEYYIAIGGDNGGAMASCTEWIFGNEIASFIISDEWGDNNDFSDIGIVNIPHIGYRKYD
jgi:lipopolysaccharide transport system ATP-binding protein